MLPPSGFDITAFACAQWGGGFVREYTLAVEGPGTLNPFIARTRAGGTVIRPILKQSWETQMVCRVAPSGSGSDASEAVTALRALVVSVLVVWANPAGESLAGNGVGVDEISSAGVRREALNKASLLSESEEGWSCGVGCDGLTFFEDLGLVTNLQTM